MEKAGKKAYMGFNRTLLLACVLAMFCMVGQRVCFGLQNESPWPLFGSNAAYWSGLGVDPTLWFDPCNWTAGSVPAGPNNIAIIGTFATQPPVYTGDPCVIRILSSQVAECNYLRLGNNGSYVNLIVEGTLNILGPGLRIPSFTNWQKCQLIVNGGTVTVDGNTDQSWMIVNSGDVNVLGEIGMGAGANGSEAWSDQYYLKIHNGNVRGGTLTMSHAVRTTATLLTDINGTGQLILKGNVIPTIAGYISNGWLTAYGGDPNYFISPTLDANGDTVVTAAVFIAAKAEVNSPAIGVTVPWEDPNNKGHGPTLTWTAGVGATSHNVYFGYTFTDVNAATTASPQYKGTQALANKSYTVPLTDINLGQVCYWRIDENDSGVMIKGDVWLFTIPSYRTVDEFETYSSSYGSIHTVWKDGATNGTGASISIDKTIVQGGLQSMNMSYDNTSSPYISEANMLCSALPGCPNDWTAANVKLLTMSLHGGQALDSNGNPTFVEPNVYVILQSNGGAQSGIVYYPDVNDFRQGSWEYFRFWAIDLAQFSAQGVNLHNVTGLVIGIGNKASPTKDGSSTEFWVDTIRLQPPTCLQHSGDPDLNNDCVVDMGDLMILADNWLDSNTVVTASAPAAPPVLWYKFNDGVGSTTIHDFSGNSYTGALVTGTNLAPGAPTGPAWGGGSGYDGNGCINLANGYYVNVPLTPCNVSWGAGCTFSFWFNDPGQDDNDSMFFQVTNGDGTNRGPQVWMGSTGFMQWACGYDPNTTYRSYLEWGQNSNYSNPLHPLNRWVHYAFVKSPGDMRIYQDGVMVAEDTVTGNTLDPVTSDGNSFFTIGAWQYNGSNSNGSYINGLMEDFRVYNYALSPGQVLSLAVAGGTATSPMIQQLLTPADIGHYEIVNFNDFALLANYWHQQALFP